MSEIGDFILSELERHSIDYEIQRNWAHVSCPFHDHSGKKRKLGFHLDTGAMHCFVCGTGGNFNRYAKMMNLQEIREGDPQLQDFGSLQRELERFKAQDTRTPAQPDLVKPWVNPVWRGLPKDFLDTIPSYLWFDEVSRADRILWPVYMNQKFKGCTSARIDPLDNSVYPKTRNLGGLDAKKILFPFDHPIVQESKSVVLVEGQFDALRLLYHGIPTLSILGTGAWDRFKLILLGARKVQRIVLALDGDLAGERCCDEILKDADQTFDVRIMVFPDPTDEEKNRGIKTVDPGNCSRRYIRLIHKMLNDT